MAHVRELWYWVRDAGRGVQMAHAAGKKQFERWRGMTVLRDWIWHSQSDCAPKGIMRKVGGEKMRQARPQIG